MAIGVSAGAPAPNVISTLRNNTAKHWWNDAGLRKLSLAILVGFCGTVNSGYDGSLFNGLQSMPIFMDSIGNPDANKLGIISAAYPLGGIPAFLPASWVADRYGRRVSMGIGAILIIIGAVAQTFTKGGDAMLATRFVIGMGSAFEGIGAAPYVAEVAHPRNRPQAVALINTCWYIGSIIAAWVCFGTLAIKSQWCWKIPCLVQAVPCVIQLVGLMFSPESPRWLISRGREEEAYAMLCTYHANGAGLDGDADELVDFEFKEMSEAIAAEKAATSGVSYRSFLKTKGNRRRLLIIILVGLYSQWVGNGIISYYLAKILTSVGITNSTQQAGLNGGLQIWNWLMAIGGSLLCERLGRRFLWLTSAIGMLLCYAAITACSAVYAKTEAKGAGYATIALLFLYFGSYDIAFTGLTLAYPNEILPFSLRTKGNAILQFTVSIALFFNQYVNPIALDALAWHYYLVYVGVLVVVVISIYFLYPETRGRTLEEVKEIFDGEEALPTVAQEAMGPDVLDEKKAKGSAEHLDYA